MPVIKSQRRKRSRASRRSALTDEEKFRKEYGTKLSKFFLGVYLFVRYPWDTPGRLSAMRDIKQRWVQDEAIKIQIGGTYLEYGFYRALGAVQPVCALYAIKDWRDFAVEYQTSQPMDQEVDTVMPPKYREVEEILQYKFTNKSLLMMALCPVGGLRPVGSTLERLEFLGDAVLDLTALDFLRCQDPEDSKVGTRLQLSVSNKALQAICLETGLFRFIRVYCEDVALEDSITAAKASWEAAKQGFPAVAPWKQQHLCKTLADVVEALFGAVFLDCEMDMARVAKVFDEIHWPVIGRRLAPVDAWRGLA
ncbi:MAG: ribonuclease III domain-containing protein [Benniella sp.]|nr:MAG: ribonuclease III domain-containing protein [Benniella sp.]